MGRGQPMRGRGVTAPGRLRLPGPASALAGGALAVLAALLVAAGRAPPVPDGAAPARCTAAQASRANGFGSRAVALVRQHRLPEAFVEIDRGVEVSSACSNPSVDQVIIARGSFALLLFALHRFEDAERIARVLLPLRPTRPLAVRVSQRLIVARLEAAAARGDGAAMRSSLADADQASALVQADAEFASQIRFYRICSVRGLARRRCRDSEDTILYGQYAGRRTETGLQVRGQFDDQPIVNPDLGAEGGLWAVASSELEALEEARRIEREIATDAARWMDAVDAAFDMSPARLRAALAASSPLKVKLERLAAAIDRFDQNPVSRFQPRALRLAVELVDARITRGMGRDPGSAIFDQATALSPLTREASAALLSGDTGFLDSDSPALVALMTALEARGPSEERAERIWRMTALSFDRETALSSPSFAQVRARLDGDEMAVVTLLAVDSTGVTMAARREGPVVIRELDPGIALFSRIGGALLKTFGERPYGMEEVPIGGARVLYHRLLCDPESRLGKASRLVFFLDSAAERFPLPLLARPEAGCARPMTSDEIAAEAPRDSLRNIPWLGRERAIRIQPFGAPRRPVAVASNAYLGIAGRYDDEPVLKDSEERNDGRGTFGPLRYAQEEIEATARAFGGPASRMFGDDSRKAPVLRRLATGKFRLIHFATHAADAPLRADGEPAIVLTRTGSRSPASDRERLLGPSEIEGLRLGGATLLLSACRTVQPKAGLGHGIVSGLGGAFLAAGAAQVVVTYWPVSDWASPMLMPQMAAAVAGGKSVPIELQRARLALAGRQQGAQSPPDPYYWAAYVVVSEGH